MQYKLWNKKTKSYLFNCKNLKDVKECLVAFHSQIYDILNSDNAHLDMIDSWEYEYHNNLTINEILNMYNEWKIYKDKRRVYIYEI